MELYKAARGSRHESKELEVVTRARQHWSEQTKARALRIAGLLVILLGLGAAFLPAGKTIPSAMIGGLLIAAGLIETLAGSLRRQVRTFAMAAGIVTALAGLLFVVNPENSFLPERVADHRLVAGAKPNSCGVGVRNTWFGPDLDGAVGWGGLPACAADHHRPVGLDHRR